MRLSCLMLNLILFVIDITSKKHRRKKIKVEYEYLPQVSKSLVKSVNKRVLMSYL